MRCEGNAHGNDLDETWNVRHWFWKQVTKADFKSFWQIYLYGSLYEILSTKQGKSILNSTVGITFEVYHLPAWAYGGFTSIYLNFIDRLPGHSDCARIARNGLCITLKRDMRSYILYDLFAIDLVSLFAHLLDIACVWGTAYKCKCFRLAC